MAKKTNTENLIKAITRSEEQDSANVLMKLKEERASSTITGKEQKKTQKEDSLDTSRYHNKSTNPTSTGGLNPQEDGLTNEQNRSWSEFNGILDAELYRDKKETFLMSLSGECLSQYEKISNGIGYKLGKKVPRNEIIRKVLEDYMHHKRDTLEMIINKL